MTSIAALRDLKSAVGRFIEEASAAVGEVDAEAQRTEQWLRFESVTRWQAQARQRHEAVEAAKAQVRRRELSGIGDDNPSAVVERRAVERAKRLEEEAHEKIRRIRGWFPVLEREVTLYKGGVQPLAQAVSRDLPEALAALDRMIAALEAYAAVRTGTAADAPVGAGLGSAAPAESMLAMLRRRTPRRAVRDVIEASPMPASIAAGDGSGETLGGPRGGVLAETGAAARPPAPGDRVIIEAGALESGVVYAERLGEVSAGDSGWHIGSAGVGAGSGEAAYFAATVAEVLGRRPALREVFDLPAGYLVILTGAGGGTDAGAPGLDGLVVEAILGPDDGRVYP